ncbi:ankyrin repeat domain-containing protein [Streptomyces sp. NPDC005805]|uniref:ankyrin repeat domain-containing protein n=1 Tax=Streptomyces sp. NPDC005805 TaxID=3157068 RepID=UPI0033DFE06F
MSNGVFLGWGRGRGGNGPSGWEGMARDGWTDHDEVVRRLDRGADPEGRGGTPLLHHVATVGSPEVVAELARRVADVDAVDEDGTTALWHAVVDDLPGNAAALAAAGADPWREQLGGWSAGRLALAGPTPGLFALSEGEPGLTEAQQAMARERGRLVAALGSVYYDGAGLACVAGIDAAEAIRRLEGEVTEPEGMAEAVRDGGWWDVDPEMRVVGVTTVPGGCVVTQPWGYAPQMTEVMNRLSAGTVCYGLYANPKSGNQGSIVRDGVQEGFDLHPGGGPTVWDAAEEVFFAYLYHYRAVAHACAYAGLRLTDARAVSGPPDHWVELPAHIRRD